eukprot:GHVR01177293.1.p1 GENE.GHVR01177293.1~~GHVR01177293.1.p1  ORF type:complete len:367 (-),score=149.82 GHVR01177293.1:33-1133(-)
MPQIPQKYTHTHTHTHTGGIDSLHDQQASQIEALKQKLREYEEAALKHKCEVDTLTAALEQSADRTAAAHTHTETLSDALNRRQDNELILQKDNAQLRAHISVIKRKFTYTGVDVEGDESRETQLETERQTERQTEAGESTYCDMLRAQYQGDIALLNAKQQSLQAHLQEAARFAHAESACRRAESSRLYRSLLEQLRDKCGLETQVKSLTKRLNASEEAAVEMREVISLVQSLENELLAEKADTHTQFTHTNTELQSVYKELHENQKELKISKHKIRTTEEAALKQNEIIRDLEVQLQTHVCKNEECHKLMTMEQLRRADAEAALQKIQNELISNKKKEEILEGKNKNLLMKVEELSVEMSNKGI